MEAPEHQWVGSASLHSSAREKQTMHDLQNWHMTNFGPESQCEGKKAYHHDWKKLCLGRVSGPEDL